MILSRLRQIGPLDGAMLVLAIASVALLLYLDFGDPSRETARTIVIIDIGVCAVFAVEFLYRWHREGWKRRFLARNWYEIPGMIPVSHPAFRSFRLLRIVRVIVILVRLQRAADRAIGKPGITYRLLARFTNVIVEAIKRPITVAVLDEIADVLQQGAYTKNIAAALDENRAELDAMILQKIRADRTAGRLRFLPMHDKVIRTSADTTMRILFEVLDDPRTDELVADLLRNNIEQIRLAIRGKYTDEVTRPHAWTAPDRPTDQVGVAAVAQSE